jgi:hypothetical protein
MTAIARLLLLCSAVCFASAADGARQVEHIVLLKWKDEVTPAQEADVGAKLVALKDKIPGVVSITFGHQSSPEAATKGHGFDAALTVIFATAAARDAYLPNPEHQAVVTVLKTLLADLAVVDYTL